MEGTTHVILSKMMRETVKKKKEKRTKNLKFAINTYSGHLEVQVLNSNKILFSSLILSISKKILSS